MGDHYVSQFYLRGFSENFGYYVCAPTRKGAKATFRTHVKNVANENKLYSVEMEQPTDAVLDKLRSAHAFSMEDRRFLGIYLIAPWKRGHVVGRGSGV